MGQGVAALRVQVEDREFAGNFFSAAFTRGDPLQLDSTPPGSYTSTSSFHDGDYIARMQVSRSIR